MAAIAVNGEYGIPDKVLQTDLVPDWSAAEVKTGVSVQNVCLVMSNCSVDHFVFFMRRNRRERHQ